MQLHLVTGLTAGLSDWRGDLMAQGLLKGALRPSDYLAFYFLGRLGYGGVDQRLLTFVSAGVQVWPMGRIEGLEPYGRLSIAHQHEESLSVVQADPFGAIFGIGDGIRHRGGFEGALGVDIPLARDEDIEAFVNLETSGTWFYDPRGPSVEVLGVVGVGLNYDL
jgi:hypothetical protein